MDPSSQPIFFLTNSDNTKSEKNNSLRTMIRLATLGAIGYIGYKIYDDQKKFNQSKSEATDSDWTTANQ